MTEGVLIKTAHITILITQKRLRIFFKKFLSYIAGTLKIFFKKLFNGHFTLIISLSLAVFSLLIFKSVAPFEGKPVYLFRFSNHIPIQTYYATPTIKIFDNFANH